jgi:hypothetical protein
MAISDVIMGTMKKISEFDGTVRRDSFYLDWDLVGLLQDADCSTGRDAMLA